MMTMMAEQGASMIVVSNNPARQHAKEMIIDSNIIDLNLLQYISAIIWGSESKDMRSIKPTSLIVNTMQTATNTVIVYDINLTGRCITCAKSRSKAQATIDL